MNSAFTGNYYNKAFEKKIVDFVVEEMKGNNPICLNPQEFARRIGILITFGHQLDPDIYQKFQDMLPQICTNGLLSISRGIQYQRRKSKRDLLHVPSNPVPRFKSEPFMEWIEEISLLVSKASGTKLLERGGADANVLDLAYLMKNFSLRDEFFFDEDLHSFVTSSLIKKVEQGNISIRTVGQVSSALTNARIKVESPELIECLGNFFLSRPEPSEVHVGSMRKLMQYAYQVGNIPDRKFLDMVCQSLLRDIDSLYGVETLRLANILCAYNSISKSLVSALFSNEFMGRLDSEMEMSASRKYYLTHLRKTLMELNRSVVLRHPEFGVPWFHSKYCQENVKELTTVRRSPEGNALKEEISEQLHALTGGWRFVKEDTHSEYYNPVAFEIQYDERGHPVDLNTKPNSLRKVKRFAIQVFPTNAFTLDTKKMAGMFMSNTRELELQGWHVINVDPFSWNSMQMGEGRAKKQYLEQTIAQAVVL